MFMTSAVRDEYLLQQPAYLVVEPGAEGVALFFRQQLHQLLQAGFVLVCALTVSSTAHHRLGDMVASHTFETHPEMNFAQAWSGTVRLGRAAGLTSELTSCRKLSQLSEASA